MNNPSSWVTIASFLVQSALRIQTEWDRVLSGKSRSECTEMNASQIISHSAQGGHQRNTCSNIPNVRALMLQDDIFVCLCNHQKNKEEYLFASASISFQNDGGKTLSIADTCCGVRQSKHISVGLPYCTYKGRRRKREITMLIIISLCEIHQKGIIRFIVFPSSKQRNPQIDSEIRRNPEDARVITVNDFKCAIMTEAVEERWAGLKLRAP